MALDAKIKSALGKKAADVLAEIRRADNLERDKNIRLAFRYLSKDESLGITERTLAFQACLTLKCGTKLLPGESAARRIGDALEERVTANRIRQIIKKGR